MADVLSLGLLLQGRAGSLGPAASVGGSDPVRPLEGVEGGVGGWRGGWRVEGGRME